MLELHAYWRSSASYRVRIALNLKGLPYRVVPVHLLRDGGEQHSAAYRQLNPQARVPLLVDGEFRLSQSLAILDYLEARHPQPALLPDEPRLRARVLAFCHAIAADVQPLQNLSVLHYLEHTLGIDAEARQAWTRHWIDRGLAALEAERAPDDPGRYCFGDRPTLADCVLVPQIYAARRFGANLDRYPQLVAIAERCEALPAFQAAHPDRQPDAGVSA